MLYDCVNQALQTEKFLVFEASFRCTLCRVYSCFASFPLTHDLLPSGADEISVIRRCGLGTGAGQTFFPRPGTSGKVNTISYRCCVFRKPTCGETERERERFRELEESGKDLAIRRKNNGCLAQTSD